MELVSLKTLLQTLDDDDLKHIALNLGLQAGFKSADIKSELYAVLSDKAKLEKRLLSLDQKGLNYIERIADSGYVSIRTGTQGDSSLYCEALADFGLLFKTRSEGKTNYTIASEVYSCFVKNKEKILAEQNINALVYKFAKAVVSYYGLLNLEEILEFYNYYHRYSNADIFPKLIFLTKIQDTFTFDGVYLYDNNVRDIAGFVAAKAHFAQLHYHKYTIEQLYVDERFLAIDMDFDFYQELVDYFTNEVNCDPSIIVAIYYFLMYEHNLDKLKQAIDEETVVDVSKLDARFDQYVKNMYQYVRCWVLKGNMVNEVNDMIADEPSLYLESEFVKLKKNNDKFKNRRLFR